MGKKVRVEEDIVQTPPAIVTSEPLPKKKIIGREVVVYGLLSAFALFACAVAAYYVNNSFALKKENQELSSEFNRIREQLGEFESARENTIEEAPSAEPEYITAENLKVEWEPKLIAIDAIDGADCEPHCYKERFIAGTIEGGEYEGKRLYLEIENGMGAWFSHSIVDDGKLKLINEGTVVQGVTDIPEYINLPGTSYQLRKAGKLNLFSEIKTVKKMFTDPELGDFYLTDSGCLVVELPDHTAQAYSIVLPFENTESRMLSITFTGGKKNDDIYSFHQLSCGSNCNNFTFADDKILSPETRLVVVGKTSNNENVYGIKDQNDAKLKEIYEDKNTVAYSSEDGGEPKSKYTYSEFIGHHPLLYWKDPLGRWVEMKNDRFVIAAEMCKPAIYLYPTEKTILSVKVHPDGGFTYTDPEYGTGWTVEAGPEGIITDMSTGKAYDYLFWEGKSNNYPVKNEGWVIAQVNLKTFFSEKLAELGMNQREITDFTKYWVRSLSDKPYYQISFLTKDEFDTLAPLEISPIKPDTVLRIMMTATGLNFPKEIKSPVLPPTPERTGFTVVEWGGVVLK